MANEVLISWADQDFVVVSGVAPASTVNTSARTNGSLGNSTGEAINDEWKWTRWFDKSGTYKVKLVHAKNAASASEVDWGFDSPAGNNLFDNVDYEAALAFNFEVETTIEIARGFHDISVTAKTTGATSFEMFTQFVQFDLIDEHPVLGESAPAIQQPPHSFSNDNVSATPTKAELQTAFGIPTSLPDGWIGILDDAGATTTVYVVTVINGEFFFEAMTKAV